MWGRGRGGRGRKKYKRWLGEVQLEYNCTVRECDPRRNMTLAYRCLRHRLGERLYIVKDVFQKKIKWEDDKRQKEKRERYLQELVALESQILLDLRTRKNSTWCNSLTNNKTRVCGVYCRVKRRGREAFFIFHVWKRKGEANLPVHQRRRLPERTAFQHHLPSVYPSHPLANLLPISR